MLKKILNIGVDSHYDASLKRKIRISNLIAVISVITMTSFIPLAIFLEKGIALYLLLSFLIVAITSFFLHANKKHLVSFYFFTISGYLYFVGSTLTFGLNSNMQYFMLVMCMIAVVMFDNKIVIKAFVAAGIILFFGLTEFMKNRIGYINLPTEFESVQENVGKIIMLLLFIITSIFFIFFKNENLSFQKEVLLQKEIIEEKNKDITASITYAKRIQQSLLTTEKYIEKNINRLKKQHKE